MTGGIYMNYDIVIIGAGPGGIFPLMKRSNMIPI